jgi:hypothetical protein
MNTLRKLEILFQERKQINDKKIVEKLHEIIISKLLKTIENYLKLSRVQELGFKCKENGAGFKYKESFYYPSQAYAYFVYMKYDTITENYIIDKAVIIQFLISPLSAKASLYDVRGKNVNDVSIYLGYLKDSESVSTRDIDLKHPILSLREAFKQFEEYVFT